MTTDNDQLITLLFSVNSAIQPGAETSERELQELARRVEEETADVAEEIRTAFAAREALAISARALRAKLLITQVNNIVEKKPIIDDEGKDGNIMVREADNKAAERESVDVVLARLLATAPEMRRERFFAALAALPLFDVGRQYLLQVGRPLLAGGPYTPAEYAVLHPETVARSRPRTAGEEAALEAHRAAYERLRLVKARVQQVSTELTRARSDQPSDHDRAGMPRFSRAQERRIEELESELAQAQEALNQANSAEVRARPYRAAALAANKPPRVTIDGN
jgi:hypothetical protein